ncbi:MAG: cobalt transporter CbiM [Brachymonas sp.]|nr:cobalt transporter CbiM [Brachymonas sp.]
MHIPDGMLPLPVTLGGYVAATAVTAYCVYKIKRRGDPREQIPKASLLAAAFFTVSLIHIPIPPTSVHLIMAGLLGVMLGYFAFPAIMVALFFQAVMFGHGGLTTLGINGIVIGLPALLAAALFRLRPKPAASTAQTAFWGLIAGAVATLATVVLFTVFLYTSIPPHLDATAERAAIVTLGLAHIPVMVIEGIVTALVAVFLQKNKPQLLQGL